MSKLLRGEVTRYWDSFNKLSKDERNAMYSLKDDKFIIIEGANKGVAVIVWDREDYLKEASKQLEDLLEVYLEVPNDSSALVHF